VLVAGTLHSGVQVWDLATGQPAGARHIESYTQIHAMATGEIGGRTVAVLGGSDICAYDLATGELVFRAGNGQVPRPTALEIFNDGETAAVVVGAANLGTITVCDIVPGTDHATLAPRATITVADELAALALTRVDGRLVAVCGGREGNLQVADLPTESGDQAWEKPVLSVAVTTVRDQPVAIRSGEDEIQVLDLATGQPAAPPPAFRPASEGKLATAEADGRAIGVCSAGSLIHAWYLDTGEATQMSPVACGEWVESVATGTLGERAVVLGGFFDRKIRIFDLETGQPASDPIKCEISRVTDLGVIPHSGRSLLIFNRSGMVRCRFVGLARTPATIEELLAGAGDFAAQDDSPPAPPRVGKGVALNRSGDGGGQGMALAVLDGTPVVLSGHDDGRIDVFTIGTALPVGPPLLGHESEVTALAFAELGGCPVAASGGRDGTVLIWDLARASGIAAIHTTSLVRDLALCPPDYCVIGTERGLLAVRFRLPERPAAPRPGRIPPDTRGARACAVHEGHVTEIAVSCMPVPRICIKGIQVGNPRTDPLDYPAGHCYVFPDRLIITGPHRPGRPAGGLQIPLGHAHVEPADAPHAHELDGGHFRISIEAERCCRALCCYRRSERDLLMQLMRDRRQQWH
jgi:WD40 repeat protein